MKRSFKIITLIMITVLAFSAFMACNNNVGDVLIDLFRTESPFFTSAPEATEAAGKTDPTNAPANTTNTMDITYEGITISIPASFKKMMQDSVTMYVPNDYPQHSDNIALSHSELDYYNSYTESAVKSLLETTFNTNITNYRFKKDKDGSINRVTFSYTVTVNGIQMDQESITYFIGNGSVNIAFTDVTSTYSDDFAASKASIKVN